MMNRTLSTPINHSFLKTNNIHVFETDPVTRDVKIFTLPKVKRVS